MKSALTALGLAAVLGTDRLMCGPEVAHAVLGPSFVSWLWPSCAQQHFLPLCFLQTLVGNRNGKFQKQTVQCLGPTVLGSMAKTRLAPPSRVGYNVFSGQRLLWFTELYLNSLVL